MFYFSLRFLEVESILSREDVSSQHLDFKLLAKDDFVTGNYLLVAGYGIYTTHDFIKLDLVAGNPYKTGYQEGIRAAARFGSLTAVATHPTNTAYIWVADHTNGCIRSINRISNLTTSLTGRCTRHELWDGKFSAAKIGYPIGLASLSKVALTLYFFDNTDEVLRCLTRDSNGWQVLSIYILNKNTNRFVFDPAERYAYFSHSQSITRLSVTWQGSVEEIIPYSNGPGHNDGPFTEAKINKALSIYFFDENTILLADNKNHAIRVIDLLTSEISTLCKPQENDITDNEGDIEECKLRFPNQVFQSYDASTFYIVGDPKIYSLTYFGKFSLPAMVIAEV